MSALSHHFVWAPSHLHITPRRCSNIFLAQHASSPALNITFIVFRLRAETWAGRWAMTCQPCCWIVAPCPRMPSRGFGSLLRKTRRRGAKVSEDDVNGTFVNYSDLNFFKNIIPNYSKVSMGFILVRVVIQNILKQVFSSEQSPKWPPCKRSRPCAKEPLRRRSTHRWSPVGDEKRCTEAANMSMCCMFFSVVRRCGFEVLCGNLWRILQEDSGCSDSTVVSSDG